VVKNKADTFILVAKWTLWTGAAITVLTVIAGLDAYGSVAHDDTAHAVMKDHRTWALSTGAAILLTAIWVWRAKAISTAIIAMSVILAGMVGATGYLGAELVYRHGIGVMRLPDVAGEGHDHEEGGDHDHDHDTAEAKPEEDHEHEGGVGHGSNQTGPAGPGEVSDALFAALKSGDEATISKLLADDVLILEGGHAQLSKADYMAGHMKSDMEFLAGINNEIISREASEAGDLAWVTTYTRSSGTFKRKPINTTSREFMTMRRIEGVWKITLIQWGKN